jgi:glucose uptake protein
VESIAPTEAQEDALFLPSSFSVALLMMLLGMFCWGSWPNTYKLTHGWRYELFYWDFALGIFLSSLLVAGTLGSLFGLPTFWQNLLSADRSALVYAFLAGVLWNLGNVLLMAGVALVGMAVVFPVSIGLALVVSTIGSYLVMPRGDPLWLFAGVAFVFAAVTLNSFAYRTAARERQNTSKNGLLVCLGAGILISTATPLVGKALSAPSPLGPYGITSLFTLAALISTFPVMGYFMQRPLAGKAVAAADYWKGSLNEHSAGLLGGFGWAMGSVLTFTAANLVGIALAGAIGQANPLVAALWGLLVWKEFRDAPRRSKVLLAFMFGLYILGLVLLALSFKSSSVLR